MIQSRTKQANKYIIPVMFSLYITRFYWILHITVASYVRKFSHDRQFSIEITSACAIANGILQICGHMHTPTE